MSESVSHWTGVTPDPETNMGFVYIIVCHTTGKKYIGRKTYWKMAPPKKRSLRNPIRDKGSDKWRDDCWLESDWKKYTGSSKSFNEHISEQGKDNFVFCIMEQYKSSAAIHYAEARLLMDKRALESDEYYNKNIGAIKFVPPQEVRRTLNEKYRDITK